MSPSYKSALKVNSRKKDRFDIDNAIIGKILNMDFDDLNGLQYPNERAGCFSFSKVFMGMRYAK